MLDASSSSSSSDSSESGSAAARAKRLATVAISGEAVAAAAAGAAQNAAKRASQRAVAAGHGGGGEPGRRGGDAEEAPPEPFQKQARWLFGRAARSLATHAVDTAGCVAYAASQTQALLHRYLETQLDMGSGMAEARAAPPAAGADGSGSDEGGGFRVFGRVTRGAPVVLAGALSLPRASHAQRCDSRAAPQACCTKRGALQMGLHCRLLRRCARLARGVVTRPIATTRTRCALLLPRQTRMLRQRALLPLRLLCKPLRASRLTDARTRSALRVHAIWR